MLRSIFTISFFISLSRILGFVRDILIARYVGVSMLSDAFFAAFRLPNFFRRIFAEGAFNSAFVPIFIEKLQDKKTDEDEKFFVRNIFSILFYALLFFTILFQIFMPTFMKILFPGFFSDPEKSGLLINLSRITIFYLIFISLVSLCSGILNSLNKFAVPASSPIILNATLIASVFVFGPIAPNYAHALSWGVFIAGILQFLWLLFFTIKAGFLVYPNFPTINSDIKKFFRKLVPGVIGANVMQINLLVDSIFASMISGAVSYLYYADRINQLPLAMIGIAIGIALLPALSRKIKSHEFDEAIKLQNMALEVGMILVIPATLALTILSYPIISSLFERGAFTSKESFFVAQALMFYSFGLPSYVLVKVMEPSFFSRGDTKTPMSIAFICLINNAVLNVIFFSMNFGYIGIVLASVISSYFNLTLLITSLIKKKHFRFEKNFVKKFVLIFIPALAMALTLYLLRELFAKNDELGRIAELVTMIAVGLIIYFITSYFSGSLDILLKAHILRRKRMTQFPLFKKDSLRELLGDYCADISWISIGGHSRRKVTFQIDGKNRLGSFAEKSHNLIEIEDDSSAEKEISALILPLKHFLKTQEQNFYSQATVTLFDNGLDLVLTAKKEPNFSQIQKLIAFAKEKNLNISSRVKDSISPIFLLRKNQIFFTDFKINLDSDIFIQATRLGLENIIKIIRSSILQPIHVVDIYSGFGAYSFAIHDLVKSISAFEGSQKMIDMLNKNAAENDLGSRIKGMVRDVFSSPITARELKLFDLAIINPPRNGASPQILEIVKSPLKNLIYVSCNPESFKRDTKILIDAGFKIKNLTAIDQFYATKHLELVAIFQK